MLTAISMSAIATNGVVPGKQNAMAPVSVCGCVCLYIYLYIYIQPEDGCPRVLYGQLVTVHGTDPR